MTYIPSYDGFYYKLVPRDKNEIVKSDKPAAVLTYSPGKYRGRYVKETAGVELRTHKRVKQEVRYYELMGWNGWNNKADYKVFEIMSFDPDDSMRVIFGAPIIHFEKIPKSRAMFKYSEYASFSLNSGFVRRGPLGIVRKKMFVFDHLAPPMHSKPTEVFELGPDGTFDALKFSKHYGGYFEVYQNIEPDFAYGAEQERKHRQEVFELQKKTLSDSLVEESFKLSRSDARASMREFRKQRKEEEKRMKAQGIDLKAKKEEEPK